jgi:hypothetical protein
MHVKRRLSATDTHALQLLKPTFLDYGFVSLGEQTSEQRRQKREQTIADIT